MGFASLGLVDRISHFLSVYRMMSGKRRAAIKAHFTISGDASEVLIQAQKIKGGDRSVSIYLELQKPGRLTIPESYSLAGFWGGHTAAAYESIETLLSQGRISEDDAQRLGEVVRQFAALT